MTTFNARKFERELKKNIERTVKKSIMREGVDIECPICGHPIRIRGNGDSCPYCGTAINFDWSGFKL